jgi:uncharacterized protein with von Willebrand factor type A (vWA) domain
MDTRGRLLENLTRFGRLLRGLGLDVGPAHVRTFVEALEHVPLDSREDVRSAGRAVFAHRREHIPVFDRAFDAFWRAGLAAAPATIRPPAASRRRLAALAADATPADRRAPEPESTVEVPGLERRQTWSDREVLRHKDFAALTPDEARRVASMIEELVVAVPPRRTRRTLPDRRGPRPDVRGTLRRSLRHGGEPVHLWRRRRRDKPRPLVVLCDISGSMEPYSRVLLQFAYAVGRASERFEAFAFGTRLTRLSRHLATRQVDAALGRAAAAIADWGGGTRIGDSLRAFNHLWGRRVLGQGATVLIVSDGWDRGDVALLDREMARLSRSCHRLVWLSPLLGDPDYEPLTRGIQAALKWVDDFLPVHNLASLEALASALSRLDARGRRRGVRPGAS